MKLVDVDEVMRFPIRADKCDKENANEHFLYGIETVLEYVKQLHTIELKRGHWISHGHTCGFWCECSECGFADGHGDDDYNYCPNCGAEMEKDYDKELNSDYL